MKYKDYVKKKEVMKLVEPIEEFVPLLNILSIIQMLGDEIGGEFGVRVSTFCENEKDIILNTEIN